MSMPKYAAKRDVSELPIVQALEAAGCYVYRELPVDLLVRVRRDPPGVFRCLECKTPRRTGNFSKDQRQLKQMDFMANTGTTYVTTPEGALAALGLTGRESQP